MTQEHLIIPPPELVEKWYEFIDNSSTSWKQELAIQAARWGADQELEACCEWLNREVGIGWGHGTKLRAARRPKLPSLKEQALEAAQRFYANGHDDCSDTEIKDDFDIIRRALESLPD